LWLTEKWKDRDTEILFKLLVFSGIRLDHSIDLLYNLIQGSLSLMGELQGVHQPTSAMRQIWRVCIMPAEFARKSKKSK